MTRSLKADNPDCFKTLFLQITRSLISLLVNNPFEFNSRESWWALKQGRKKRNKNLQAEKMKQIKKECWKKETSRVGLKAVDWVVGLATEYSSNITGIFLKWKSRDEEWLEICKTKKTRADKKNSLQKLLVVVVCSMYNIYPLKIEIFVCLGKYSHKVLSTFFFYHSNDTTGR